MCVQFNLILIFFFFHEFLILLSQYSNARKSNYVETILNSLQRIENLLFKQSTQQTLNCLVPIEKLFALISEASNDDSNEVYQPNNINLIFLSTEIYLGYILHLYIYNF